MNRPLLFLILSFLAFNQTFGQELPSVLSWNAGLSIPTDRFGDDDYDNDRSGGAGIGINLGAQFEKPLKNENLSFIAGVNLIFNPLSNDYKFAYEDDHNSSTEFKFFNYISMPISGGLKYKFNLENDKALFLSGGASLNLLKITNLTWIEDGYDDWVEIYKPSTSLGFFLSGGLEFSPTQSIVFSVRNLGTHNINGSYEYGSKRGKIDDFRRQISLVTLSYQMRIK